MTTQQLKKIVVAATLPLAALVVFNSPAVPTSQAQDFDAAATYKAKCNMCHGPKAERKFDAAKSDDELLKTVLESGKPGMPAFKEKGITADQAKAIIGYMKSLHQ